MHAEQPAAELRPLRADARRNRLLILDAAIAVFAEHAEAAQMDVVAARAGVGVGTLYRHFPDKEALITAVVLRRLERIASYAGEALQIEDPWDALTTYIWRSAEDMVAEAGAREVLTRQNPALEGAPAALTVVERSRLLVRRAHLNGTLRKDFHEDDMRALMCGLGETVNTAARHGRDWRRHVTFTLDGLRSK